MLLVFREPSHFLNAQTTKSYELIFKILIILSVNSRSGIPEPTRQCQSTPPCLGTLPSIELTTVLTRDAYHRWCCPTKSYTTIPQAEMSGLPQSGSDCHQMGPIWDFLRSDFSTFFITDKSDLKIVPLCVNLTNFLPPSGIHVVRTRAKARLPWGTV